jgi:SAM-dependent methyltransferase
MKLIDGLKLKGKPLEIPDCGRDDLPQLFVEMGFKKGVEIGVAQGEFSEKLAQVGLQVYAVDPWRIYDDYTDAQGQKRMDSLHDTTQKRLSPYKNCTIIRKTSVEAAEDFEDDSLDFVYIDGNHHFRYVAEDLCIWYKKVRKGGIICGHDYIYTDPRTMAGICHVIYVLNAFVKAYKVDNWYILGRKERLDHETRDRFRSWMFVKNEKGDRILYRK